MTEPTEKRTRRALGAAFRALDTMTPTLPLAAALSTAMREDGDLGPREKRSAAHVARGIMRELRRLDLALALACDAAGVPQRSISAADRTVLRYLAFRVSLEGENPPRVINELRLPSAPRSFALGEPKLLRIGKALPRADALPVPDDPVRAVALRRSVPDALARRLVDEVGLARADAVLEGLNRPGRWDLRVNRLLASRDEVARALADEGVSTRPCALSPDGLVADDRKGLFGAAHRAGLFELQDEGSQLIALACGARPGETALDFCAGSGGKSLALAASVGPGGTVHACDPVPGRLADLGERVRRARAAAIVHGSVQPPEALAGRADVVLVDAPCSGLGSLRREVDLRWRLGEAVLDAYPPRQLEILLRAAAFVRPGGRLVYATCSPLRAECEDVVAAFLAAAPAYARVDVRRTLPASALPAVDDGGCLRTWPDLHDTGAFFAALLVRAP